MAVTSGTHRGCTSGTAMSGSRARPRADYLAGNRPARFRAGTIETKGADRRQLLRSRWQEDEMNNSTTHDEPDPRRWWALALLCGAFFMVILDAAIVTVALPSIEHDLGFSAQGLQWVVSAYALTFAGLLLLGGRAADLLGRRRVFMVGVVLFTLASLLC